MPGKMIVFEGLDGSGISTQSGMLKNWLESSGHNVLLTKEQTDGLIGGIIKSGLRGEWLVSPLALQLLFAADRAQHLEKEIEPALAKEKYVVVDRYILSSLAFGSLSVDAKFLRQINAGFRKPDMTIFVDTATDECIRRMSMVRYHVELFEKKEKLEDVRKNYLSLLGYFPNTIRIDGNRTKSEVFADVKEAVLNILE
ncbi:MAG: dTMP kinase [Candidatus Aenigmarchaeota archaeon]|nr:dTMP kinase [Candidatus Aenigmarchaeota archaeon]